MSVTSKINEQDKILTISIIGKFDFSTHPNFRKCYIDIDPSYSVVVDMSKTEYMDSAALGMLLLLDEHFMNSKIQIINTSEFVRKVLDIANFDKKFSIA